MLDSYSTWKKRFTKIIIDAKDLEYGEVIGEGEWTNNIQPVYVICFSICLVISAGEFSMVFQAEYTAPKAPVKQVAVKNLKSKPVISAHVYIEYYMVRMQMLLSMKKLRSSSKNRPSCWTSITATSCT